MQFRIKVLRQSLEAGISIGTLANIREMIEDLSGHDETLCSASHMGELVEPLLDMYIGEVKAAIGKNLISVAHDGTPRRKECFVVIGRWCDDKFVVHEVILDGRLFDGSLKNTDITQAIGTALNLYGVDNIRITNMSCDSAATNLLSARRMLESGLFPNMIVFPCLCHLLNNAGKDMKLQLAPDVMKLIGKVCRKVYCGSAAWTDACDEAGINKDVVFVPEIVKNTRWHDEYKCAAHMWPQV